MAIRILVVACASMMLALTLSARAMCAEEDARSDDRFLVYLGGFSPHVDSTIKINGEIAKPPPIDVENTLGVQQGKEVLWGGARWQISNRHSVETEIFILNRDGMNGFDGENIGVGNYIVEAGSIVTASDLTLGRVTYGFKLGQWERSELELKTGLHIVDISAALHLIGNVCDTTMGESPPCPPITTPTAESENLIAPLPHLGASYHFDFSENWALRLQVIGFAIELDNIDGSILEIDADVSWHPWRHFGLGAGFRYFDVDVKSTGSRLDGEFEYGYVGPAIYFSTTF